MPRVCSICVHPRREAIDRALVGGSAKRDVSALFRVSHGGTHEEVVAVNLAWEQIQAYQNAERRAS